MTLIGHFLWAALLFLAFFLIEWSIFAIVGWLNSIRPMPDDVMAFMHAFETWFMYADAFLSSMVLLAGVIGFLSELFRRES
ncbi:MAG: hypothetical protein QM741_06910 [Rudaea sp.]|uniref:hypothetical protein n=1 Tax=Rudaea sp. TaxID=2136325 RepID=UPI0039E33BBB